MGPTLYHEHLYCDIAPFSGKEDNRFVESGLVAEELGAFLRAGGRTIVEATRRLFCGE